MLNGFIAVIQNLVTQATLDIGFFSYLIFAVQVKKTFIF
jgi:hypothetical protein